MTKIKVRTISRKEISKIKEKLSTWMFWRKRRYVIVLMSFLGYFVNYSLRVNLSVAIVEMTKNRTLVSHAENLTVIYEKDENWNKSQSGLLLSGFFMGYIVTQGIPGYLSSLARSNQIIGFGTGATAILTLFAPLAAKHSFEAFLALRIIQGFMSGGTFPAMLAIWSKWAPPLERSRMSAVAYCGIHFGIIVTNVLAGILIPKLGWESIFYLTGCLGILWFIGWTLIVRSAPECDRFCTTEEKVYIESQMEICYRNRDGGGEVKPPPWKSILTSAPIYACILTTFSDEVGGYILMTQYPTFLRDVLHFEIESTGLLSAVPYLIAGIVMGPIGILADWLRLNTQMTTTRIRKIFNAISNMSKAGLMIGTALLIPSKLSAICVTFVLGVGAFSTSVNVANPLDIAPQYASLICGIVNTIGTIPGIVFPFVTGYITDVQTGDINRWPLIFYTIAAIYLTGSIVFCTFGSGEMQDWVKKSSKSKSEEDSDSVEANGIS